VLDLWLAGEAALTGTSSLDLIEHYLDHGVPIIALSHRADPAELILDDRLLVMDWPPDRRELEETVGVVIGARGWLPRSPNECSLLFPLRTI
jgi:hypothetical protein